MVAVHRATPKNVEFALKENSGRQRRRKPVIAPQPVEWVMLPRGRALSLKSSRYIVVDFDGRFRMVRTIKRANADDRWKVVSQKDPFSAADLESTPAEFTCSRGTREEVNLAAQCLERHPVDAFPPDPDHEPVPRRLFFKQRDFMCIEEFGLRNTDDNNAEVPEPTTGIAPPNLPAEAASSSSAPTPSVDPALPASATEVPDQVMSEGTSSSPDAVVRLSMKRSSHSSNSESETKRLHTDHSTRDVVMLLDDSEVSHAVERCREVCRRKGTFLVDVE